MPEWYIAGVVFIFGLIIGSFLNVVIYRFHTGKSLNDRSHCLSCGTTLRWYELFPVFSYAMLHGRCRTCSSFIPYRYALVELLTGTLFLLAYFKVLDPILLAFTCIFLAVLVIVAVYDLYHLIIPDELSFSLAAIALATVGYESWLLGSWSHFGAAVAAAAFAFAFFASLWWFSGGRWLGFGDAKLAVSLGVMVGITGVFSLVVWAFWVGAIVSLGIMAWQRLSLHIRFGHAGFGGVTMKSEIPFAPFLIVAFLLVYFLNAQVLTLIESLYVNF